jgi:hypothetical protein
VSVESGLRPFSWSRHLPMSCLATTAPSHMPFEIIPARELLSWDCTRWVGTIESLSCVHILVNATLMSFEICFKREG